MFAYYSTQLPIKSMLCGAFTPGHHREANGRLITRRIPAIPLEKERENGGKQYREL